MASTGIKHTLACMSLPVPGLIIRLILCMTGMGVVRVRQLECLKLSQYDLIAGVSVGFMVVPQGLSYAVSAGVPSVFGLYGAFLPCLVYSLLGTSKQLAVGPVAVTSLLIYANLQAALPCAAAISNPNTITDPAQRACQDAYNQAVRRLVMHAHMPELCVHAIHTGSLLLAPRVISHHAPVSEGH